MRYTGEGFTPVMIANDTLENVSAINFLGNEIVKKHPIVKDWLLGPPSAINIDSLTISFPRKLMALTFSRVSLAIITGVNPSPV